MRKLAEICARRPVFATMLTMAMVVIGLLSYSRLGVDLYPRIDLPSVVISTFNPGAGPTEIETEISARVEAAVNTVSGVAGISSTSMEGISTVAVIFDIGKNGDVATQEVRDRVSSLPDLPSTASVPKVEKLDPDAVPIVRLVVSSNRSLAETTQLARKLVERRLEKVSGVGQVRLEGGLDREVRIVVDPERLRAFGMTVPELAGGIRQQNFELPGGRVNEASRELTVRTLGSLQSVDDLPSTIVSQRGRPIALREVADVVDGSEEARGVSRWNGAAALSVVVMKQSGQNTVKVIDEIKTNLADIRAALPPGMTLDIVADQSIYIRAAIDSIKEHLIIGSLFAAIVVLLFLRNLRATLIAAIAIPVSLIATFALIEAAGYTLNQITMLALALMVGIVIDDAIVVLENVSHVMDKYKLSPVDAAIRGTQEISLAVLATTFSLLAVFLPVGFMQGIIGRFLASFGLTSAFAVFVSMIVSFTLTPAMCARILKPGAMAAGQGRGGFYLHVENTYMRLLDWSMRHRLLVAALCVALVLSTVPLGMMVGKDFQPVEDLSQFQVNVQTAQGSSLAQTLLVVERIAKDIHAQEGVTDTLTTVGGSSGEPVNQASIFVRMKPLDARKVTQSEAMSAARQTLTRYPMLTRASVAAAQAAGGGASGGDVQYIITGPDLNQINKYATALVERMKKTPQATDVASTIAEPKPELSIAIDRARAADLGVSAADVAQTVNALVAGQQVGTMNLDGSQVPLKLQVQDRYRSDPEGLRLLVVPSSKAGWVGLRDVATIREGSGPAVIQRLDRQRQVTVSANVLPGASQAEVSAAFERELAALKLEPGYRYELGGTSKQLAGAVTDFGVAFGLAFVFMYMVLAAQFESFSQPVIILMTLPLSVPCGLLGLLVTHQNLNIYSGLGILLLFGVVKKNAILQMAHTNDLRASGMSRDEAIHHSNRDRLRPILMTTLALVAGMIPLVLATGPGSATSRSMGVLVAAGQTLCLVLTLVMVPVFYTLIEDFGERISAPFKRMKLRRATGAATILLLLACAFTAKAQVERPGVHAGSRIELTLQHAIELALSNNPDLKISHFGVESSRYGYQAAKGAYDPVFSINADRESRNLPVSSALGGGDASGKLHESDITATPQLSGLLPWGGATFSTSLYNSRTTTENTFSPLSPQYNTSLNFTLIQPLFRDRHIDMARQQLFVARKNIAISESQFRQRVLDTVVYTVSAYWDLVSARANLETQRGGREQAHKVVESSKRRTELGLQADIDVVESQTQESALTEAELGAMDFVNRAENQLKMMMFPGVTAVEWQSEIIPTTNPSDVIPPVSFEEAVARARANRPELEQLLRLREINAVSRDFAANQLLPRVDFVTSYTSAGQAGIVATRPANPLLAAFGVGSLSSVPPGFAGGYGQSLDNLFTGNYGTLRFELRASLPIRNRTAEANIANAGVEQRRLQTQSAQVDQAIEADVRNAVYALGIARQRLQAARDAASMAQAQYSSEIRRFDAGLSSVFLVTQRQISLLNAKLRETQVLTDVNKAVAGYYRAVGDLLEQQNVRIEMPKP